MGILTAPIADDLKKKHMTFLLKEMLSQSVDIHRWRKSLIPRAGRLEAPEQSKAGFLVSQSVGISLIPAHGGAFLLLETDACWVTAVWAVSYNWHGCCVGICICPSLLSSPYPRTQGTPKMEQWRVGCALSSRVLTRPDLIVPPNLPVNFLDWWLRGGEAINKQF